MIQETSMQVIIDGLGFIMYSPSSAAHIAKGSDYLATAYWKPSDVEAHVRAGTIVAFSTSSPGTFQLIVRNGKPTAAHWAQAEFKIVIPITVFDETVCIRDLYDLMKWNPVYPATQAFVAKNGFYAVHVSTTLPTSGLIGDSQTIELFFEALEAMPTLLVSGVPELCF